MGVQTDIPFSLKEGIISMMMLMTRRYLISSLILFLKLDVLNGFVCYKKVLFSLVKRIERQPKYASPVEEDDETLISPEEAERLKAIEKFYPTSESSYISLASKRADFAKAAKAAGMAFGMDNDTAAEAATELAKTFTPTDEMPEFTVEDGKIIVVDKSKKVAVEDNLKKSDEGFMATDSNIVVDLEDDDPKLLLF